MDAVAVLFSVFTGVFSAVVLRIFFAASFRFRPRMFSSCVLLACPGASRSFYLRGCLRVPKECPFVRPMRAGWLMRGMTLRPVSCGLSKQTMILLHRPASVGIAGFAGSSDHFDRH